MKVLFLHSDWGYSGVMSKNKKPKRKFNNTNMSYVIWGMFHIMIWLSLAPSFAKFLEKIGWVEHYIWTLYFLLPYASALSTQSIRAKLNTKGLAIILSFNVISAIYLLYYLSKKITILT